MKRKGTFAARAAKKGRTGNQPLPLVVNTLANAECLPANLRHLLKGVLPVVLNAYKADRHAYENEVVDQAQQALGAVEAALAAAHKEAMSAQEQVIAPAENGKRTAAKKAADSHLEAVKAQLEANKATNKACEKAVHEADDAVKAAVKEEKVADKELQRHVDKKSHLTGALANEFATLRDGNAAGADAKKAVNKILAIGKEFGLDSTLLHTLPLACKTPVAARTEFQTMMFSNLAALIEHQIEAISANIAEAEPVKAGKSAALAAARDAHAQAEAALKTATDEVAASVTANKEAHKEVTKTDHHRRKIWEDMRHACEAQDHLADELKNLKENVWGAFNQLKEKEPEPEPVEPEPVAEEAHVEEAAAAAAGDAEVAQ